MVCCGAAYAARCSAAATLAAMLSSPCGSWDHWYFVLHTSFDFYLLGNGPRVLRNRGPVSSLHAAHRGSAVVLYSPVCSLCAPNHPLPRPILAAPQVRIARLLWAVARFDMAELGVGLEAARNEVMGPFSAAAMESYSRAYPQLIKLHMLQEISDVAGGSVR